MTGLTGGPWEGSSDWFWTGVGEGSWEGGQSLQEFCVSTATEHTDGCALGDKDTTTAATEVGAPAGGKEESAPDGVHSGDKHPTTRWGAQTVQAGTFPLSPHLSPATQLPAHPSLPPSSPARR